MTQHPQDLDHLIAALEDRFDAADDQARAALQADLQDLIARYRAADHAVPERLADLERRMADTAEEDGFDNLPL